MILCSSSVKRCPCPLPLDGAASYDLGAGRLLCAKAAPAESSATKGQVAAAPPSRIMNSRRVDRSSDISCPGLGPCTRPYQIREEQSAAGQHAGVHLARIVGGIDVGDAPRPDAVELDHGLLARPGKMRHACRHHDEAADR